MFKKFSNPVKGLYLTPVFFVFLATGVFLYLFSYVLPWLWYAGHAAVVGLLVLTVVDYAGLLRLQGKVKASRKLPDILSNGDTQQVSIEIRNYADTGLRGTVIDEAPVQLQIRDLNMPFSVEAGQTAVLGYHVTPQLRGVYRFHDTMVFIRGRLGLSQMRLRFKHPREVKTYPSVIQMKHFEHQVFSRTAHQHGNYRLRKLGQSYEFEQIREYVAGDDHRSINWKASSRRGDLMVNLYDEERSQNVYCMIDKSRVMNMPFNGLSLLDYAINTTLVISNIALRKGDKAGLVTFTHVPGSIIPADNRPRQLHRIMEALYREQPGEGEADYEMLHPIQSRLIRNRSLIFFFTHIDHRDSLERILPVLRHIQRRHLLIVVFFKNTEIEAYSRGESANLREVYYRTIARTFIHEKDEVVENLRRHGIASILTAPDELNMRVVRQYLELKSTFKI